MEVVFYFSNIPVFMYDVNNIKTFTKYLVATLSVILPRELEMLCDNTLKKDTSYETKFENIYMQALHIGLNVVRKLYARW